MKIFLLLSVVAGTLVGLLASLFCLTVGFQKIRQIEDIVGYEGGTINDQKSMWGEGPIGRWMRVAYLMNFFFWRQFPGHGVKVASKLGDTTADVPKNLRAWLVWPMTIFWIGFFILMIGGGVLGSLY